jgi:hypothetical protein
VGVRLGLPPVRPSRNGILRHQIQVHDTLNNKFQPVVGNMHHNWIDSQQNEIQDGLRNSSLSNSIRVDQLFLSLERSVFNLSLTTFHFEWQLRINLSK